MMQEDVKREYDLWTLGIDTREKIRDKEVGGTCTCLLTKGPRAGQMCGNKIPPNQRSMHFLCAARGYFTCSRHRHLEKQCQLDTVTTPAAKALLSLSDTCDIEDERYTVNENYDCSAQGEEGEGSGACDPVCRCKRITSVEINYLTEKDGIAMAMQCAEPVLPSDEYSELTKYFIWRLCSLVIRNAIRTGSFDSICEAEWSGGYYGDEFNGFRSLVPPTVRSLAARGIDMNKLLAMEYDGKEGEEGKKELLRFVDLISVDVDQIIISNQNHFRVCKEQDLYPAWQGIVAVCSLFSTMPTRKFTMLDGYHRLASAVNRGDTHVKILLVSKE